jgi:hypothetical protein
LGISQSEERAVADAESSKSGTSLSQKLPNPDRSDGDLDWVKTLGQADQLNYFTERLVWQQAKVKFEAAEAQAATARDKPRAAFDDLVAKYKEAAKARDDAMAKAATLKGDVEKAEKKLNAAEAGDSEKTAGSIKALQDAIQNYGLQAADVAKAKTSLDQIRAALDAKSDKHKFNPDAPKMDTDIEATQQRDYDLAVATAAAQMDSGWQKFDDIREELKSRKPS